MARVPKCFGCKHFDVEKMSCVIHIDGIPKYILNEVKTCEDYHTANVENDDDLPIAIGR